MKKKKKNHSCISKPCVMTWPDDSLTQWPWNHSHIQCCVQGLDNTHSQTAPLLLGMGWVCLELTDTLHCSLWHRDADRQTASELGPCGGLLPRPRAITMKAHSHLQNQTTSITSIPQLLLHSSGCKVTQCWEVATSQKKRTPTITITITITITQTAQQETHTHGRRYLWRK